MRLALKRIGQGLVVILAVSLAWNSLTYGNFDTSFNFLRHKQAAIATGWYLPFYYSHVLVSAFILVFGLFLVSGWGRNWMHVHRALGYFYVMGILFFAAPGGLIMSLFIGRGPWVLASFLFQVSLWFIFTSIAFNRIRAKQIDAHRAWMLRSFALTFAAVTLRLYIFVLSYSTDLGQPTAYAALAWASWVPNWLFVEWIIYRENRSKSLHLTHSR